MQQQESSLSDAIFTEVSRYKHKIKETHSAESTPKTVGEYHTLINDLLDATEGEGGNLDNTNRIQNLLGKACAMMPKHDESIVEKSKKRKNNNDKRSFSSCDASTDESKCSSKKSKTGKITSSKMAKVDCVDIKRQVTYPYLKLTILCIWTLDFCLSVWIMDLEK